MFTLRASSRLARARARATFASASTAVDASAVLEAARARRAELAPIDRDGGKTAVSSARTMEELCAAVREVKALSAHAAVTAVARAAFGGDVVEHYLNNARVELAEFNSCVTDWERVRGFERL